jgi:AbrB family looped-hinge helix DNA binding protein
MNPTNKTDTVRFSTKGQVVIPAWLRKAFAVKRGTKAIVQATPNGILLRPLTEGAIRRGRGIIKKKPGEKPFSEWWAEYKREEIEMEERKLASHRP